MKNIKLSIIASALIGCSVLTAKAQTADEIIQKHITAIGGTDNWKKITSVKMAGSVNAGGMELPVTVTKVNGKGFKAEFTINGMTGYMILTPTAGWAYNPMQGQQKPEALTAEDVKQSQDELDIPGPLFDYKTKGCKIVYLGKDEVEGTECHKLKVTLPNGKEQTMYFDATSYYHIRTVEKTTANGKEEEQISNYGNFQKLPEGIVFPMSIDEGEGPMAVKSVEVNKPVDDNLFKPAEETKK
jgi:hypothetical protein